MKGRKKLSFDEAMKQIWRTEMTKGDNIDMGHRAGYRAVLYTFEELKRVSHCFEKFQKRCVTLFNHHHSLNTLPYIHTHTGTHFISEARKDIPSKSLGN